jgi:hypothetical protein
MINSNIILIISGHGTSIEKEICCKVPSNMDIIFFCNSEDDIESNIEMENIILTQNYNQLNSLFNDECVYTKNYHDIGNTTNNTLLEDEKDYEYFRYNRHKIFRDILIDFSSPFIFPNKNDIIDGIEIMKIGIFNTNDDNIFYKVIKNNKKFIGLSSDNKYMITDKNQLKKIILEHDISKYSKEINYSEEYLQNIIKDDDLIIKNYLKSSIGNLIPYVSPSQKIRLSNLLMQIKLLYQEYNLLIFVVTCRK